MDGKVYLKNSMAHRFRLQQPASDEQLYFKIPRIIAELSRGLTLAPGGIIVTGTPSDVGFARSEQTVSPSGLSACSCLL
jgi:2-keto-4-pentenoate hydratase/2-oxohepta-3-ene-1,7-dioic acid hydratase in catechol pathway